MSEKSERRSDLKSTHINTPWHRNHIGGRYHLSGNVLPVGCGAIYSFGVRDTRVYIERFLALQRTSDLECTHIIHRGIATTSVDDVICEEMSYLSDVGRFTVLVSVIQGKNGALDVWCLFVEKNVLATVAGFIVDY
ncbi:hypothetical protein CEXT_322301 [Caerostris extrusa]|uniref:Uncharacterized protein n=1 Tax=Caerostris extrusa TaxID=172846 RepID=A0AAV4Q7V5_CAEEX|nr:hypothetical protein CEXT_322301 [Caerostris extrusa]